MSEFTCISAAQANDIIAEHNNSLIVDIRDEQSYANAHIDQACHLHNGNVQQFILEAEFDQPIIIYCYHGISSQSAANMFAQQGFEQVYSVDGGYEAWQQQPPQTK